MTFDHGVTITVHRTTSDRYGDTTDAVSHVIEGCGIAPHSSTESTDRRDTVVTGLTLLAPAGADLVATDVVELPDGALWSVSGDPRAPQSPFTGWQPGIRAALTRVTG
jgi:hypothetical protein